MVDPTGMEADGWRKNLANGEMSYDDSYTFENTPTGYEYSDVGLDDNYYYDSDGSKIPRQDNGTNINVDGGDGTLGILGNINTVAGYGATAIENTPGSFRMTNGAYNGSSFSPKYYASGWTGGSRARISTYNIGKIGKAVGTAGFGAGILLDGIGVANYYDPKMGPNNVNSIHPGKAAVNTGMGAWGLLGGPYGVITSGAYSGVELLYPGGVNGLLQDQAKYTKENQKVLGPSFRMVPLSNK